MTQKQKKTKDRLDLDALVKRCIVPSDRRISLKKDFSSAVGVPDIAKQELQERLLLGIGQLSETQDRLYAFKRYGLLIIVQAMDAAGKDSLVKHVMSGVNPQGCQVTSFKAPSRDDLAHDYLWRACKVLPERGCIGIFNRSYYEEVLIARVHPQILQNQQLPAELVDRKIWKRRFDEMNNFEQYLVNNGIIVLKFFLYVSKDEQKKRFLQRIDNPDKNWKFTADDVNEREFWNDYVEAYEDCLSHTSTKWAPWYVIPADHKPITRLAVAHVIQKTLKNLDLRYPVNSTAKAELLKAKEHLLSEK